MQKQEPEESGDWSDGSGWKRTSVTVQRFSHAPARPTSPAESESRDSERPGPGPPTQARRRPGTHVGQISVGHACTGC